MDGEKTGFEDKQGKPIHYADILQVGLDSRSRMRKRVVRFGKRTQLANPDDVEYKYGGYDLTKEMCKRAVILEHLHK